MMTFGMVLIPKEQLYSASEQVQLHTLELTMRAIIQVISLYSRHIFFASKKGLDFLLRVKTIVTQIQPATTFKSNSPPLNNVLSVFQQLQLQDPRPNGETDAT